MRPSDVIGVPREESVMNEDVHAAFSVGLSGSKRSEPTHKVGCASPTPSPELKMFEIGILVTGHKWSEGIAPTETVLFARLVPVRKLAYSIRYACLRAWSERRLRHRINLRWSYP